MNKMNTNTIDKNWFNQPLAPVNLNNLEYTPDPEETITDLRVTRSDKHVDEHDDYIAPLKKPKEDDPIAKLDLADTHINKMSIPIDYESTYKTMDPLFEMLFKPLDDPLFQPNPELEKLDELLSQMYNNSLHKSFI
jgi:hypothetical protein